jgi:hypothetical protein
MIYLLGIPGRSNEDNYSWNFFTILFHPVPIFIARTKFLIACRRIGTTTSCQAHMVGGLHMFAPLFGAVCSKPGLSQTPLGANAKAIQILSDLKVGDGGRVQCEWNVLNSNEFNHLQQSISKHLALHRKLHQVHLPLHIKQCSSAGTTPV